MEEAPLESAVKRRVRSFWDRNPCGTRLVDKPIEGTQFFREYDARRLQLHPYLADVLPLSGYSGRRILEVGCGIGSDAASVASRGAYVTAFDLSPVSVALTQRRFKEYGLDGNFVVGDAEHLPFRDRSYDYAMSIGVLHHTPDTATAINELHRVLTTGGSALVMLYYRNSFRYRIVFKILSTLGKRQIDDLVAEYDGKNNPLGKVFSKEEAEEMFFEFKKVHTRVYNFDRYDIARVFENISYHLTRLVAKVARRIPRSCYDTISRIVGLDLYIFALKD